MSPTSIQGLLQRSALKPGAGVEPGTDSGLILCLFYRQGLGSGVYISPGDQLQESVYSNKGKYEDPPSSSRPRPVGGSTGTSVQTDSSGLFGGCV